MCLVSFGAWFHQQYSLAIFTTALSAFLSWPFAGILGYSADDYINFYVLIIRISPPEFAESALQLMRFSLKKDPLVYYLVHNFDSRRPGSN